MGEESLMRAALAMFVLGVFAVSVLVSIGLFLYQMGLFSS